MSRGNYRAIRLKEHGLKVYEKVLEGRLREIVHVDDRQFGFMSCRSTTSALFIMKQMQQKYGEKRKKLFHVFVDLEKAFDHVQRKVIEWALKKSKVPERLADW